MFGDFIFGPRGGLKPARGHGGSRWIVYRQSAFGHWEKLGSYSAKTSALYFARAHRANYPGRKVKIVKG